MKKALFLCWIFFCLVVLLINTGCNNNSNNDCFKTQKDSIEFVKKVMNVYPNEFPSVKTESTKNIPKDVSAFSAVPFQGITWQTVMDYSTAHDSAPLMAIGGVVVKGLMIDENGLTTIRGLRSQIKKIYLRFGRKSNGDYTIMLLPVDDSGNVNKTDGLNNYDHLDPCPTYCPKNFE